MAEEKALQNTNQAVADPASGTPQLTQQTAPHIPLPVKPKAKKSFLKNPLFYIVLVFVAVFLGAYYYIYQSLENHVAQLTHEGTNAVSPRPTLPPITPSLSTDQEAKALTDQAQTLLAQKLKISPTSIQVISAEKKQWPDSSLGCPKPGYMYSQIVTEGYQIILKANNQQYDYHAGLTPSSVFLCEK